MNTVPERVARIALATPNEITLSGSWTARGIGAMEKTLGDLPLPKNTGVIASAADVDALDTAGAWVLQNLLRRIEAAGNRVTLQGLTPQFATLLKVVTQKLAAHADAPIPTITNPPGLLTQLSVFEAGTATIVFNAYDQATMTFVVDGLGGSKNIVRQVF